MRLTNQMERFGMNTPQMEMRLHRLVSRGRHSAAVNNVFRAGDGSGARRGDQSGRKIQIAENLHQPIDQAIAVVRGSRKPDEARKFVAFVLSVPVKQILKRYGYE